MDLIGLLDLDAMLHIIANAHYSKGNRDNSASVKAHVRRFASNIATNSGCSQIIPIFQNIGFDNFRNYLLPEYKDHRTTSDAIALWKPTIVEAFQEIGGIALNSIETDDAQSVLAEYIGYDKVKIITGDKDMKQVPTMFYNPYKKGLNAEERHWSVNVYEANRFFWEQVLAGDSTDMPGKFCGIEGVGMVTASKICDKYPDSTFKDIIKAEYTKKYGSAEGFKRANITYKMVRLLKLEYNDYAPQAAKDEIVSVTGNYEKYIQTHSDPNSKLFVVSPENLFN